MQALLPSGAYETDMNLSEYLKKWHTDLSREFWKIGDRAPISTLTLALKTMVRYTIVEKCVVELINAQRWLS